MMFQPHGFTPMRMMGRQIIDEFTAQMNNDISSQDLVNYAKEKGKQALFFATREDCGQFIIANARSQDRIVIMGARDNTLPEFCKTILKEIK